MLLKDKETIREDEVKDVSSYCMTFRREKLPKSLEFERGSIRPFSGDLTLEEARQTKLYTILKLFVELVFSSSERYLQFESKTRHLETH